MSHKVHPKAFKIREIGDWLSRGFYRKKFPQYLEEDYHIRKFLQSKLPQGTVEDIELERGAVALKIIIKTARPALIIGRGGRGVEEMKAELERYLNKLKSPKMKEITRRDIKVEILEVKSPWSSASLVSQWVAGQLEKMVPFRRTLKMTVSKVIEQKEVQGVRVEVSGRLNGVEISRREWLKEGRLPRQSLRAVVDYGFSQAYCSYGVIGVKVWIYKGDRFA